MGLWERFVAPSLISCACSTKPIMKQRQKVVPKASGRVLEIGCGAGTNFPFYDGKLVTSLVAVEPSVGMLKRALKSKALLGDIEAEITNGDACALSIDDNSIDTAVVTFVLCTIPDWRKALSEVRRVLKPDGRVLFSEHGLAPDEGVSKWQRRIEPIWRPIAAGCHLTRDTIVMLKDSGLGKLEWEKMYLPSTPRIAGYVTWGEARKS